MRKSWIVAAVALCAGACKDTAVVNISNGIAEVANFEVRHPVREGGSVSFKLERSTSRWTETLSVQIPAWTDETADVLISTNHVKAVYRKTWSDGQKHEADQVSDAQVHVIRHSGLAGENYRFECAITFAKVVDGAGKELGKKKFEVNFDGPIKDR